ncbi:MAG: disulfide bond formation protein DsbA [Actinomycetia bacterium]|nr:disulfide bond formation protein DsbA [Actinomycetes bacterium]MCP4961072.1 disulfide bond formation protein DsbA [Actinomycetes bacterium]
MTARWVVDEVAPERELEINWKSISLYFKNEIDDTDSPVYKTHQLLRVFEAIKAAEGNEAAQAFYWECGRQIHHDGRRDDLTTEDLLEAAGLDVAYASAMDDAATWDPVIEDAMNEGLALAGDDIGTPIITFDNSLGERVGYFGPVITRVPDTQSSLDLWDGLIMISTVPGFWELKRTRTERPDFGPRP